MNDPESLRRALAQPDELSAWSSWWATLFERERDRLDTLLPGRIGAIEHIGSTAVPDLDARPVIDILVGMASMAAADALLDDLCAVGYVSSPDYNAGLADRRWLMRHVNGRHTHDLHLVVQGSEAWDSHVGFRDALRADAGLRERYLQLKRQVVHQFGGEPQAYTRAKNGFIADALKRAGLPGGESTQARRTPGSATSQHDGVSLLARPHEAAAAQAHPTDLSKAASAAEQAIYAAGLHLIASRSRLSELVITRQKPDDVARQIRRETETLIHDVLLKRFPLHGFLGADKSVGRVDDAAPLWVVDALSGISSYVRDHPLYAVSVALVIAGEPQLGVVYDPLRNEFFGAIHGRGAVLNGAPIRCALARDHAGELASTVFPPPDDPHTRRHVTELGHVLHVFCGVRRGASVALEMAYLAAGRIDAFWARGLTPLDTPAGIVLARESGALVESRDEQPLQRSNSLLACTPGVRDHFAGLLNL